MDDVILLPLQLLLLLLLVVLPQAWRLAREASGMDPLSSGSYMSCEVLLISLLCIGFAEASVWKAVCIAVLSIIVLP